MIPKKNNNVAPSVAAAPTKGADFKASAKGTKPTHILKYKEGAEGKFQRITGLFEGVSKNGEKYLRGTDKESGVTYVVMLNNFETKQG